MPLAARITIITIIFILPLSVLRAQDTSVTQLIEKGIQLRTEGKLQASIEAFNQALQFDAHSADAYAERAISMSSEPLLRYDLALKDIDMAIQLSENRGEFYFQRAVLHFFLKDYENSQSDLTFAELLGYEETTDLKRALKDKIPEYVKKITSRPDGTQEEYYERKHDEEDFYQAPEPKPHKKKPFKIYRKHLFLFGGLLIFLLAVKALF